MRARSRPWQQRALPPYVLARQGLLPIDGQTQGIVFVLVVGASTDDALLLASRHCEELAGQPDAAVAVSAACPATAPPVLSSAVITPENDTAGGGVHTSAQGGGLRQSVLPAHLPRIVASTWALRGRSVRFTRAWAYRWKVRSRTASSIGRHCCRASRGVAVASGSTVAAKEALAATGDADRTLSSAVLPAD
ncbi:MMPL family transporter [Streptomyces parvus]|uniref:MMPL family transporter n=1 Tax=Streptomyces parvus TaxID=66428 RepID=UPI0033F3000F